MNKINLVVVSTIAAFIAVPGNLSGAVISNGSATLNLTEGVADGISEFNAYFNDGTSRADTLALPAPGTAAFIESPADPATGTVSLIDPVRPHGVVPAEYPGTPGASRSRQVTNLDFDPANILGTWGASTDSFGTFVSLGSGEQIALTSMQRWTGPFTGSLLYGDFALRYVPGRVGVAALDGTRSGLVLVSNIDFLNSSWADIANATISSDGNTLTISGDLLISGALNVLDPSATIGKKFGTFSLTAVVPEPASLGLLGAGACLLLGRRRSTMGKA